jgi:hypothetical protein
MDLQAQLLVPAGALSCAFFLLECEALAMLCEQFKCGEVPTGVRGSR